MLVKNLLAGLAYRVLQGNDQVEVNSLAWDSRAVQPQALFICVPNRRVDRHDFASQAVTAGAIVLIIEHNITSNLSPLKLRLFKSNTPNRSWLY
jgi:UDP-N-acetylmuramoyl-L-alanyl-D-glutamate--2,6-diaminopimelate ligase